MAGAALLKAVAGPRERARGGRAATRDGGPLWLFLALPLILLMPFVVFLRHFHYELLRGESLLAMALITALGLTCAAVAQLRPQTLPHAFVALFLAAFVDISTTEDQQLDLLRLIFADQVVIDSLQNLLFPLAFVAILLATALIKAHLSFIAAVVFSVMLGATLLFSQPLTIPKLGSAGGGAPAAAVAPDGELPPIVHIVLDEQIGVAGLPPEVPGAARLQQDLKAFYSERGFALFGQAFSHYYLTIDSLPNMLNGTAGDRRYLYMVGAGDTHRLLRNAWFDRLAARGYRIKVIQNDHLDYCATDKVRREDCLTYPSNTIYGLMALDLGLGDKTQLLFESFLQGTFATRLAAGIQARLRPARDGEGTAPEAASWHWHPRWLGSTTAMQAIERLKADLADLRPGTLYFAHLLLPHHALIYDRECRPEPRIERWMNNAVADLKPLLRRNEADSRAERYTKYFEQVRCTHKKLDELFAVMRGQAAYERAIVIVHGDHGSRISLREPMADAADEIEESDFRDNYAALYAVRHPDWPSGYRDDMRSIQALFAEHFLRQPLAQEHGNVYLMRRDEVLVPRPMPAFPR